MRAWLGGGLFCLFFILLSLTPAQASASYESTVLADQPQNYWRLPDRVSLVDANQAWGYYGNWLSHSSGGPLKKENSRYLGFIDNYPEEQTSTDFAFSASQSGPMTGEFWFRSPVESTGDPETLGRYSVVGGYTITPLSGVWGIPWELRADKSTGKASLYARKPETPQVSKEYHLIGKQNLLDGEWHLIQLVQSGSNDNYRAQLWVDGEMEIESEFIALFSNGRPYNGISGNFGNLFFPLTVSGGGQDPSSSEYLASELAEVAIYMKGLSQERINARLRASGRTPPKADQLGPPNRSGYLHERSVSGADPRALARLWPDPAQGGSAGPA